MSNQHFRIYTSCFLIKGIVRSMLYDIQRTDYQFIPNGLFEILTQYKACSIDEIKGIYKNEFDETIDEYFDFLVKSEYVFLCDKADLELFPDIDLTWDHPAKISNAIIDVNSQSLHDFESIFEQFEQLGTKYFQLRVYDEKPFDYYEDILTKLEERAILSTELIIKASEEIAVGKLEELTNKFPRIHNIIVHSATENKIAKIDSSNMGNIIFAMQQINNVSHCGIISPNYFSINIQTSTESQKHNTCLNRKISIDVNGEIKNCPSMTKSYGNIKDTTLQQAIDKEGFTAMWYIHKDQIEVCKDCEFRHICTDCRAYIQEPNNIYSKPAKCSYDPYTATWGNENPTNNPLHGK